MNDLVISEKEKDGTRYLTLDVTKSTFRNFHFNDLGDWGKRKLDNYIVLSKSNDMRKKIQVIYAQAS